MDAINELILQAAASPWLLLVMFTVAIIDGFFPPIPSETVLVAAAALAVASGSVNLLVLGAVAAAGAMIGDNIAYAIGRSVGVHRFRWMRRPRVVAAFAWAQRSLDRGGARLILTARYIPVGRVAVNMSAGALAYPWRRFLPLSAIAARPGRRSVRDWESWRAIGSRTSPSSAQWWVSASLSSSVRWSIEW